MMALCLTPQSYLDAWMDTEVTHCNPGSVNFFLQLLQLHFQDLLIGHVPCHLSCRKNLIQTQYKIRSSLLIVWKFLCQLAQDNANNNE